MNPIMKKTLLFVFLTTIFTTTASAYVFPTNLKLGSRGEDVKNLQILLNLDKDTQIATSGAGSPNNETTYFGPATHRAVINFQNKYKQETLTPAGLTTGTGFVGALTRKKLSTMGTSGTTVTTTTPTTSCLTKYDPKTGKLCAPTTSTAVQTCLTKYDPKTGKLCSQITGTSSSSVTPSSITSNIISPTPAYSFSGGGGGGGYTTPSTSQTQTPTPTNGGWSAYGTCSATACGTTGNRVRTCNNPTPLNGGAYCSGTSSETCSAPACGVNTYTLTATAGANGVISPLGGTTVSQGGSQTYTITPNAGYQLATLTIGGGPVSPVSSYTFTNVQGDNTINATFSQIPEGTSTIHPSTGLPIDSNGWTVFTPSADTRKIYISNSAGLDTNDGLSENTPVKTIAKGKTLLRNNYPDWMLLKKGDVWTDENIGTVCASGRSATEPMLISSYGTGARPLIKTNPASGGMLSQQGISSSSGCSDYSALVGIEFYAYTRDPNSPNFNSSTLTTEHAGFSFMNGTNWQLLEDNKFSFYGGNSINPYPSGTFQNISLRRNVFANNYSTNSHSQGLFSAHTSKFLLEENVWDHNGWNEQVTGARATIFNRNMYLSNGDGNTIVRGNIDANGASGGVQVRTGGIAENNLFLRTPVSISFGHKENQAIDISGIIRNNVTLGGRDIGVPGEAGSQANGTGIWISSNVASGSYGDSFVKDLEVYNNIIAHNKLSTNNIVGILVGNTGNAPFTNMNIHDNIVYDWTRDVWPTTTDHRANGFNMNVSSSTVAVNSNFFNNIIQQVRSGYVGMSKNYDTTTGIKIYNNKYWSAEAEPPATWSQGWFELFNLNSETWESWLARTGDTGSTKELVSFPGPNRSIETYMTSLGMTPTYEAFMERARQQSKDNWDPRFTAPVVNNYIREGFGRPAI